MVIVEYVRFNVNFKFSINNDIKRFFDFRFLV